ncbi:hypothetical protein KEM48_009652 [Puccinia striiformis f. sp. tritici PST-130]|nr:hypothetical protein KEM48_009652 [Puccinia striiformis f. sp. tritici PST-130]
MALTRKLFRLRNPSKDSGLSFHCCGKPDDLLDEPLDLVNEKCQQRGYVGFTNAELKISERHVDSMLVATLCNEHRLMKERTCSEALPVCGPSPSWPCNLSSPGQRLQVPTSRESLEFNGRSSGLKNTSNLTSMRRLSLMKN